MKKSNLVSIVIAVLVILIVTVSYKTLKTDAKENTELKGTKYYTSVFIEDGDTLWSIAQNNLPEHTDINDYIKEIKKMNNLNSNQIHTGNKLVIYYYR